MAYKNNIPLSTDIQSVSQLDLFNNFAQLDTSFGIDHVTFSDVTADNGKHNQVTYVVQSPDPTTAAVEAKEFSKTFNTAASNPMDAIHFTKGPSEAIPRPLTSFQNTAAFNLNSSSQLIVDLTGVTQFFAHGYISYDGDKAGSVYTLRFDSPGTLTVTKINSGAAQLTFTLDVSNNLQITRTGGLLSNIYYSIEFIRIS